MSPVGRQPPPKSRDETAQAYADFVLVELVEPRNRIKALESRNVELERRVLELEAQAAARDGVPR